MIRYALIFKVYSKVATNAISYDAHAQDLIDKLHVLNEIYCATKSTQQIITIIDTSASLKKLLISFVKIGKNRSLTFRRIS